MHACVQTPVHAHTAHACVEEVGSLGAGVAGSCELHYMGAGTWLQCRARASVACNCGATALHTSVLKCYWLPVPSGSGMSSDRTSWQRATASLHIFHFLIRVDLLQVFFFHKTFREFWIVSFYETELGALCTGWWWVLTIRARKFWNVEVCHRREKPLEAAGKITESSAGHRLLVNYECVHSP